MENMIAAETEKGVSARMFILFLLSISTGLQQ